MPLEPGQSLLHYRLVEKIGEGGMGVVWRAQDTKLDREVALKVLPAQLAADPERRARFEREAKAVAALNHPNIVTIHSVEEANGIHFLTMELVPGQTLSEMLPREALPLGKFFELAVPIADALSEAHRSGITHRDLKPQNVMVSPQGRVKILDFGLAKLREAKQPVADGTQLPTMAVTQEGKILGTVAYMSPEQAEGKSVDHRSDIFSLGVLLYEMATGKRPFVGDTSMSVLSSIIKDEPPSVIAVNQALPRHLGRIIGRCLAKKPDRRYQSTMDLRNELDGLQGEVASGEHSTTMSSVVSMASPAKTSPRPWWPWALVSVVVVVAGGLFWGTRSSSPVETAPAAGSADAPAPSANPASGTDGKMAVVLPFENLGPPEDAYFAAGMSEEITSRLAAVSGLGVISRTSATQYDRSGKSIRDIGRDLGVDYVLEGTVRWAKRSDGTGQVRVTPQLISVTDDRQLWSEVYDRNIDDIFQVQTDIANRVIEQMDVTLSGSEQDLVQEIPTQNMEAYRLYLQAMDLQTKMTPADEGHLVELLEKATELDPEFIEAWSELSSHHSNVYSGYDTSDERRSRARRALQSAEKIDSDHHQTRLARGSYYYYGFRNYDQALEEFLAATKLVPNDAEARHFVGLIYRRQGQWDKSIENLEAAFQLDPRDGNIARNVGTTYAARRDFESAIRYHDKAIDLEPDNFGNVSNKAMAMVRWKGDLESAGQIIGSEPKEEDFMYRIASTVFAQLSRDYPRAIDQARKIDPVIPILRAFRLHLISISMALSNGPEAARNSLEETNKEFENLLESAPSNEGIRQALSQNLALLGRDEAAVREAKLAVDLTEKDQFSGPQAQENLARIYAEVGRPDEALDLIERLLETVYDDPITPPMLKLDPAWDHLRDHPRFQALIKK